MSPTSHAAEAALFSALLEAAADAILVIDERGTIRQANSACTAVFGYQPPEMLGRNINMLMPEPYVSEHDNYLKRYIETGESKIIGVGRRVHGRRASGEVFPMDLSVGEGRFSGERLFVGIVRDLSETQDLLEQLKRQEAELRQMLDSAVVATGLLDASGTITRSSAALDHFLGLDNAVGSKVADFLLSTVDDFEEALYAIQDDLNLRSAVCTLTLQTFAIGPVRKLADTYLAATRQSDPGQEPLSRNAIVLQLVDRTEQVSAQAAARRAEDRLAHFQRISTLGEMTAGIAHEVNQPIGAIANYAQAGLHLLRRPEVPVAGLPKIFEQIHDQSQRAGDVIKRLRSLATDRPSHQRLVSLDNLIDELMPLAKSQLGQNGSRLSVLVEPNLPPVLADRVQIQQVMLNLLRNAIDAMDDRPLGVVSLRARAVGGGVRIEVQDSGHGVPADIESRILEPFFSSKSEGMGIGLSICQSIVDAHQGRLWFAANDPGPGTTFFVQLPAAQEPDP